MRHTTRIILGMLLGALSLSQAVLANHNDGWDNITIMPADDWDHGASEGQSCNHYNGGYGSCNYGLVCYDQGYGGGTCRRACNSYYDCHAGQYCQSNGYQGVCLYEGEGGGGYYPPNRPDRPNRPGREAYEGQNCSPRGNYYPRCGPRLYCDTYGRSETGICRYR